MTYIFGEEYVLDGGNIRGDITEKRHMSRFFKKIFYLFATVFTTYGAVSKIDTAICGVVK